jgi:hypothetical protein
MSWRNAASLQAQQDLDGLLAAAIEFAQQQLAKHGEFYPFVLTVATNGTTTALGSRPTINEEQPASSDVIAAGIEALIERRDQLRACAVTADVRLPNKTDAIRIDLEHRDGHTISALLPYTPKRKKIEYGQLSAHAGQARIWPDN